MKSKRWLLSVIAVLSVVSSMATIAAAKDSGGNEKLWRTCNESAAKEAKLGHPVEAQRLYETALHEAEKFGADDLRLASSLMNLAILYHNSGKFNEAEPLFSRALPIYEKQKGADSKLAADALEAMGANYRALAKFPDAEKYLNQAITVFTKCCGSDSIDVANAMNQLGRTYLAEKKLSDAENQYKRALSIYERKYGEKSERNVLIMHNLAQSYTEQRKFEDAEQLFRDALAANKDSTENEQKEALLMSGLASLYRTQGKYDEADKLYPRILQVESKIDDPLNVERAITSSNYGLNLFYMGRYDEAEGKFKEALAVYEKRVGLNHPGTNLIRDNLVALYNRTKRYPEAETLLVQMLGSTEQRYGAVHTQVGTVLVALANVYEKQDKFAEAKSTYERLLKLDEQLSGAKSPRVAADLKNLARMNEKLSDAASAASMSQRAQSIEQQLPGASRVSALSDLSAGNAAAARAEKAPIKDKWAVVIGISNFKESALNLKYAAKDATDFRNFLVGSANFKPDHVKLLTDGAATRDNIVRQLGTKWLGRLANSGDLVVIFISSHGTTVKEGVGANFLVASDTDTTGLIGTGIPMQWLSQIIKEQVHSDRVVLILDVCHSGSASSGGQKGLTRSNTFNVENVKLGSGQAILCSSLADQVSWESKNYENSVFTRKLIDALTKHGDRLGLTQAYDYLKSDVESEVLRDRGELQTPALNMKAWDGADPVLSVMPSSPRPGMQEADGR